jgi:hypothetical protein
MNGLHRVTACAAALALAGCAYYVAPDGTVAPYGTYPVTTTTPANFDQSFAAAVGALRDQGLTVTTEDRAAGNVIGTTGDGGSVTASLRRQADGSVRVQFDSRSLRDPQLLDRVSRSYERRMGR